eukprot:6931321-Pyramimonas_sp.AAC.1
MAVRRRRPGERRRGAGPGAPPARGGGERRAGEPQPEAGRSAGSRPSPRSAGSEISRVRVQP